MNDVNHNVNFSLQKCPLALTPPSPSHTSFTVKTFSFDPFQNIHRWLKTVGIEQPQKLSLFQHPNSHSFFSLDPSIHSSLPSYSKKYIYILYCYCCCCFKCVYENPFLPSSPSHNSSHSLCHDRLVWAENESFFS